MILIFFTNHMQISEFVRKVCNVVRLEWTQSAQHLALCVIVVFCVQTLRPGARALCRTPFREVPCSVGFRMIRVNQEKASDAQLLVSRVCVPHHLLQTVHTVTLRIKITEFCLACRDLEMCGGPNSLANLSGT